MQTETQAAAPMPAAGELDSAARRLTALDVAFLVLLGLMIAGHIVAALLARGWITAAESLGLRLEGRGLPSVGIVFEVMVGARDGIPVEVWSSVDGELPAAPETPAKRSDDPTLATLHGSALVGFTGYSCVSCHVWNGTQLSESDPGAVGPDLTKIIGRIRRGWFERFLEDPARFHPGTPIPASAINASRTGVRLTPSLVACACATRCCPGLSSP